jgi:hypothetical protein
MRNERRKMNSIDIAMEKSIFLATIQQFNNSTIQQFNNLK